MSSFYRGYQIASERVNIKEFVEVTESPVRSGIGTVTITATRRTEWVQKLRSAMESDFVGPAGEQMKLARPLKVTVTGEDYQPLWGSTFLLETYTASDIGDDSVTFGGRYSECLTEDEIIPLNYDGRDYLASPAPDNSFQALPLPIDNVLRRVVRAIQDDGGGVGWRLIVPAGLPLVAVDSIQRGKSTFADLLDSYYQARQIDWWTEWDEQEYRIVVARYAEGGTDRSDETRFVRGVVSRKAQRTFDPRNLCTHVVVTGKYGSIGRAVNNQAMAYRAAHGLGRRIRHFDRTDIFDIPTAQDFADRLLPWVTSFQPVIEHQDLDTDVEGTPVPDIDFGVRDLIDSYTNEVEHEVRPAQRMDMSVVRNGYRGIYSLTAGGDERDILPIIKSDPNTTAVDPKTTKDIEDLQRDVEDLKSDSDGGGEPSYPAGDGVLQRVSGEGSEEFSKTPTVQGLDIDTGRSSGGLDFQQTGRAPNFYAEIVQGRDVNGTTRNLLAIYADGSVDGIFSAQGFWEFDPVNSSNNSVIRRLGAGTGGGGENPDPTTPGVFSVTPQTVAFAQAQSFTGSWENLPAGSTIQPLVDGITDPNGFAIETVASGGNGAVSFTIPWTAFAGKGVGDTFELSLGYAAFTSNPVTITVTDDPDRDLYATVTPEVANVGDDQTFTVTWTPVPDGTQVQARWNGGYSTSFTTGVMVGGECTVTVPGGFITTEGISHLTLVRQDTGVESKQISINVGDRRSTGGDF